MAKVRFLSLAIALCFAPACGADAQDVQDDGASSVEQDIRSYQAQVSPWLRRGSQPDHAALVRLQRDGYESIVNLRSESDRERGDVLSLGMDPHHVSVRDQHAPTMTQVVDFLDFATRRANQPVFIHCLAGVGRTGVFVAAYRMAVQGWSESAAIDEARGYGLSQRAQLDFLHAFASALRNGQVPRFAAQR